MLAAERPIAVTDNYASGGDFLYTCEGHLQDYNFARAITASEAPPEPSSPEPAKPSQKDIDAAVKEYEDRKKEKGKDSKATGEDKAKSTEKTPEPRPVEPPVPTRFALHKHFYDMRLRIHQQKQQQKEAQARRSKLEFPTAPASRPIA